MTDRQAVAEVPVSGEASLLTMADFTELASHAKITPESVAEIYNVLFIAQSSFVRAKENEWEAIRSEDKKKIAAEGRVVGVLTGHIHDLEKIASLVVGPEGAAKMGKSAAIEARRQFESIELDSRPL